MNGSSKTYISCGRAVPIRFAAEINCLGRFPSLIHFGGVSNGTFWRNRSIDLSLQDGTLVIQQVILWVDRTFGVFHVVQGFGSKFNNPRHRCPLLVTTAVELSVRLWCLMLSVGCKEARSYLPLGKIRKTDDKEGKGTKGSPGTTDCTITGGHILVFAWGLPMLRAYTVITWAALNQPSKSLG